MENKPLTTEDLYGASAPQGDTKTPEKPLEYEETPVIEPITTPPDSTYTEKQQAETENPDTLTTQVNQPKLSPPHDLPRMPVDSHPVRRGSHTVSYIIAFILLFVAGIWISSSIRQYLPSDIRDSLGFTSQTDTQTPTPTNTIAPTSVIRSDVWKSYDVISGVSKKPVPGISFMLPPDVLPPICDGSGCASQGTYLPGNTRFTVAARGVGQSLRDYRGTSISDVNGVTFTTKDILVAGKPALQFTGTFTGRTISGYSFATMKGVMIPLTDTTSVEFNHFVPSGIVADFQSDDALFDAILSKIRIEGVTGSQKGAVFDSLSPTSTRMASPTGILQ